MFFFLNIKEKVCLKNNTPSMQVEPAVLQQLNYHTTHVIRKINQKLLTLSIRTVFQQSKFLNKSQHWVKRGAPAGRISQAVDWDCKHAHIPALCLFVSVQALALLCPLLHPRSVSLFTPPPTPTTETPLVRLSLLVKQWLCGYSYQQVAGTPLRPYTLHIKI